MARTSRRRFLLPLLAVMTLAPTLTLWQATVGRPAASAATVAASSGPDWVLVDRDGFNTGALDRKKWTPFAGKARTAGDDTYWDPKMVSFGSDADGTKFLRLRNTMVTDSRGRTLHSAGIGGWGWVGNAAVQNCDRSDYWAGATSVCRKYGRVDVRLRMAQKQGVSAVGLLWPTGGVWPPEVDFFEVGTRTAASRKMEITNHWLDSSQRATQWAQPVSGDFTKWHTVSTVWSPTRIAVYVDHVKKYESRTQVPSKVMWPGFQSHFKNYDGFNLADGQSINFDVDWIRVFRDDHIS